MGRTKTLFTITGLKARVLRILVGVPLLAVGSLLLFAGYGAGMDLENVILLVFGAGLGFTGVYNILAAIRGKDVPIKIGSSKPRQE